LGRKHWIWIGALVALIAVVGATAWGLKDDVAYARIATGYAAKQTCSCVHVSGRALESCTADFPEEAREQLTVTQDANITRASVLFGAISAEARFDDAFGCTILD
jgi:hypothetical protein